MQALILNMSDPFKFKGGAERIALRIKDLLEEEGFNVDLIHEENSQKVGGFSPYWIGRHAHLMDKEWELAVVNNLAGVGFFPGKAKKTVAVFHILYLEFFEEAIKEQDLQKANIGYREYLVNKYLNGHFGEVFVLNAADRIVAVSESLKESIKKHVEKEVLVVQNPVDGVFQPQNKEKIRERFNIPKDAFVGLYVGRNDYTKGYDIFRELVSYTYRDVFWVQVISSGGLESSMPLIKDIITFREVPFEEMPIIYNLADFLVFPSRYEGFGLSIVEALACGIPIITLRVGIVKEIEDLLQGLVVNQPDPKEFFDRIMVLKRFKVIRDYYKHVVSEEIRRRFSVELWKKKMKETLLS